MEQEMGNPDLYKNSERWPVLLAEFEVVTRKLETLNHQWNDLAMRAAEASAETVVARAR